MTEAIAKLETLVDRLNEERENSESTKRFLQIGKDLDDCESMLMNLKLEKDKKK